MGGEMSGDHNQYQKERSYLDDRNDIIAMAREAGLKAGQHWDKTHMDTAHIERFAELVAAAEREACAALENEPGIYSQHDMAEAIRARGQA